MKNMNMSERVAPMQQAGEDLRIGQILARGGKMSGAGVEMALRYQGEHPVRFGEAAVRLGLIDDDDLSVALAQQFRMPRLPARPSRYSTALLAATAPESREAEALRAIRTQLNLRWFKDGQKRLAMAAVSAGDGASTLIANLAVSFAQMGKRTVIVDANLRDPVQHRIFNLANQQGVSDILVDRASLECVARIDGLGELAVLPAGPRPPNPTELVSNAAFFQLLDLLALRFDVILCDAPAMREAVDAVPIASAAGGVMFVARKNRTALNDVRSANQQLIGTDIQVVGSILLDF